MQRKLNEQFIKQYSREFSEKITSGFFAKQEHITGKEILTISPSRQINFFVLKILFANWQDEMKKLESPYFNYRDPEVRRAMVDFMNILSQKILIDEDHFYELMIEAVNDTLKLALLPQKFLYDELIQKDINTVNEKIFRPLLKYLKLHKAYFEKFFDENAGEELDTFLDKSREFFEGVDVQETAEAELEQLNEIHPIRLEDLVEAEPKTSEETDDLDSLEPDFSDLEDEHEDNDEEEKLFDDPGFEKERDAEDEPKPNDLKDDAGRERTGSLSSFETELSDESEESLDLETESSASGAGTGAFSTELENTFGDDPARDLAEELSVGSGHEDVERQEEAAEELEAKQEELAGLDAEELPGDDSPDLGEDKREEDYLTKEPVNEKFSEEKTTINDRYTNEERFTVADKLEKKKVDDIMEAISVNHRYMFTKELFDGDREEFNGAISKIEKCNSFDDAVEILVQDYAKERSWDMNSDEVKELLKVVFRKFR